MAAGEERVQPHAAELLADGVTLETEDGAIAVRRVHLGELAAPSGKVVAGAPLAAPARRTRAVAVPPGVYPVEAGLIDLPEVGERYAWAMLRLRDQPAAYWMAVPPEGARRPAGRQEPAISAFMDVEAATLLAAHLAEPAGGAELRAEILRAVAGDDGEPMALDLPLDDEGRLNAVLFASGAGSGVYPTYAGYADGPEPVCLLTDFLLMTLDEE